MVRRSYLEAAFRHPVAVFGPLVLVLALAVFSALSKPRDYVSTAAIWADTPITDASSVGTTGGTAPPSAGQQALMSQLLTSRHFVLDVGTQSGIPGFGQTRAPKQVAAAIALLVASTSSTTPGPNVLSVAVTQPDAARARAVTAALLQEFLSTERATLSRRAQAQLDYARAKVAASSRSLASAQQAVDSYQVTHGTTNDSQAASLGAAVTRAQGDYSAAQQEVGIYETDVSLAADPSVLFVMDQPSTALPKSRLKMLVLGVGGGLLGGLTVALLALVTVVKRDRSARVEADIERILGLPVSGVIPRSRQVSRLVPHMPGSASAGEHA